MRAELLLSRDGVRRWVAVRECGRIVALDTTPSDAAAVGAGRVIRARVGRVVPGLDGAFVDLGAGRSGWLARDELCPAGAAATSTELRSGQERIVQVSRVARPGKAALVTERVELCGRWVVLLAASRRRAVSRRVRDAQARTRLEQLARELEPAEFGFVVRRAAESTAEDPIREEARTLAALWRRAGGPRASGVPATLVAEPDLLERTLRDAPPVEEVDGIVVDDVGDRERALAYLAAVDPRLAGRVRLAAPPGSLFDDGGIASAIEEALAPRVALPSGGRLIFEETAAVVSVDVDSRGGADRGGADARRQANLEAADEIPRQLRLRRLAGVVVVDWADLSDVSEQRLVAERFEDRLRRDPVRTRLLGISEIGLLQMTREREGASLSDLLTEPCAACAGRGRVRLAPAAD